MGISVEWDPHARALSKMKTLLILVSVAVAVMGQGPEGGEGLSVFEGPQRAPAPDPSRANYDRCKCQCVFPAETYYCKFTRSKKCGNCESRYKGRKWCYVDGKAGNHCSDTKKSGSGKYWSFEACTTPAVGTELCPYK